jgi:hypothetical protein
VPEGGERGSQVRIADPGAQRLDDAQGRAGVRPRLGEVTQGPLRPGDPILHLRFAIAVAGRLFQPQRLLQARQRLGRLSGGQPGLALVAQGLALVGAGAGSPEKLDGVVEIGESRGRIAKGQGRASKLGQRDPLPPAVADLPAQLQGAPLAFQRFAAPAESPIDQTEIGERRGLFRPVADLAPQTQRLFVGRGGPRPLAEPMVDQPHVVEDESLPAAVVQRAKDLQRGAEVGKGLLVVPQLLMQQTDVVEGPRLSGPVAESAHPLSRLAVAVQRRVGLAQDVVNPAGAGERGPFQRSGPYLAQHRQGAVVAGEPRFQLAPGQMGDAQVAQRRPLAVAVADLPLQRDRLLEGRPGLRGIAQLPVVEPDLVPGGGLPEPVAETLPERQHLFPHLQGLPRIVDQPRENGRGVESAGLLQAISSHPPLPHRPPVFGQGLPPRRRPFLVILPVVLSGPGHRRLGRRAVAAGLGGARQLVETDLVPARRGRRLAGDHLDRIGAVRRRLDNQRLGALAVEGSVHDDAPAVRPPGGQLDVDPPLLDGDPPDLPRRQLDPVGVGLAGGQPTLERLPEDQGRGIRRRSGGEQQTAQGHPGQRAERSPEPRHQKVAVSTIQRDERVDDTPAAS